MSSELGTSTIAPIEREDVRFRSREEVYEEVMRVFDSKEVSRALFESLTTNHRKESVATEDFERSYEIFSNKYAARNLDSWLLKSFPSGSTIMKQTVSWTLSCFRKKECDIPEMMSSLLGEISVNLLYNGLCPSEIKSVFFVKKIAEEWKEPSWNKIDFHFFVVTSTDKLGKPLLSSGESDIDNGDVYLVNYNYSRSFPEKKKGIRYKVDYIERRVSDYRIETSPTNIRFPGVPRVFVPVKAD